MIKKFISALLLATAVFSASAYTTETVQVPTTRLESPLDVTVIVPDAAADGKRFPTVYILNGFSGNHTSWMITQPRLGELADQYGMVMVMPDGRDSWYWDSPIDPKMQMESCFVGDLMPYIDNNYPPLPEAKYRAITGLSMGGHGGLWLRTRHPDRFGSMGSTSGGVNIIPFPKNWKMAQRLGAYEDNKDRWAQYTVVSLVPQMKANGQNIIFDCGVDDFFADVNNDLHRRLVEAQVPHDYISRPGAHTHEYWANSILYQLLFFNQAFQNAKQ